MPGITEMGTTFNLPNFVGELFEASPTDTPFLSMIGGLTGGKPVDAVEFQWQGYDLRDPSQRVRLEGADAPDEDNRTRKNVKNVVQIHQEAVSVSYTKLAATGQHSGANISGSNPVKDELKFQISAQIKSIARDVEFSLLNGTYAYPSDNTAPRKTRGLSSAIVTNVKDADGDPLTRTLLLDLIQAVWDSGGLKESVTATIIANSTQKRKLSDALVYAKYQGSDRNVGGVDVKTIETDFGTLNILLNRYLPKDMIIVASLDQCQPSILEVPQKGFLFYEPLAKTGASEKGQLYGEIGLEYGNEAAHGKITGLSTVVEDEDDEANG